MLNSKSIGNKIAGARKKMYLSQAELAQKVLISPQAVGKWERGESMPDIPTLNRLAEIFGVDLNYFSASFDSAEVEKTDENMNRQIREDRASNARKSFEWNWDMSRGNWVDADFSGLKNLKEKFSSSNIKNCKFMNSELSGLILAKNNIEMCDFSNSDLRNSQIELSNLLKNRFNNCSFIDAVIRKSNIGKCDFSAADFSGAEFNDSCFESNLLENALWKFSSFKNTGISDVVFQGSIEDCHFENCSFYGVTFENATLLNTFFKYNRRFKKVQFINCKVDKLTYAFLKSNQADLSGISLIA
jgi:uncharacterized protein YjbI with pentapeptide repeats